MAIGLKKKSELKSLFQIRCNLGLQCQNCKPKIKPANYFGLQTHLLKITNNSTFIARGLLQARILFIHMFFLLYIYFMEEVLLLCLFCFVSFTK